MGYQDMALRKAAKNGMTAKKGFAMCVQFQHYPAAREKWLTDNHEIIVIEEIKTMFLGMVEIPDPILIGKTKQEQAIMVMWGVIYFEKEKPE